MSTHSTSFSPDELDAALCRRRSLSSLIGQLGRRVAKGQIDIASARAQRLALLSEADAILETLVASGQFRSSRNQVAWWREKMAPEWARGEKAELPVDTAAPHPV